MKFEAVFACVARCGYVVILHTFALKATAAVGELSGSPTAVIQEDGGGFEVFHFARLFQSLQLTVMDIGEDATPLDMRVDYHKCMYTISVLDRRLIELQLSWTERGRVLRDDLMAAAGGAFFVEKDGPSREVINQYITSQSDSEISTRLAAVAGILREYASDIKNPTALVISKKNISVVKDGEIGGEDRVLVPANGVRDSDSSLGRVEESPVPAKNKALLITVFIGIGLGFFGVIAMLVLRRKRSQPPTCK